MSVSSILSLTGGVQAQAPVLVEPSVREVITSTLERCHAMRVKRRTWVINVSLAALLACAIIGGTYLLLRHRATRPSTAKELARERKSLDEINRRLREYSDQARENALQF